ncbi:hypothetical protein HKBW3S09_01195 [Candidatus Hakubella thermalkaliphila]|uniref:Uncharacterized protein n=1 Tax=Candidatus Hakubella thermalkaliphila TaxID=2754717 RepID=A0A6V8NWA4_9ACTN|nr:hypothetical protein HKBW3S09_01195 [Candidatus Hakubella thermalkaliphila]
MKGVRIRLGHDVKLPTSAFSQPAREDFRPIVHTDISYLENRLPIFMVRGCGPRMRISLVSYHPDGRHVNRGKAIFLALGFYEHPLAIIFSLLTFNSKMTIICNI